MTDAELWNVAARLLMGGYVHPKIVTKLVCYVARYTDPTPLAECLERISRDRGGRIDEGPRQPCAMFGGVTVYFDGVTVLMDRINGPTVATAGELHRLLDTMGVKP